MNKVGWRRILIDGARQVSLSELAGKLVLRASEAPGFVGLGFVTSSKPVASDLFGARQPVSAGDSPENHLANSTENRSNS